MEQSKIDLFMMQHNDDFASQDKNAVREKLGEMPDERFVQLSALEFKSPTIALILAGVAGTLGIDSFYLKKIGFGICKLGIYLLFMGLAIVMSVVSTIMEEMQMEDVDAMLVFLIISLVLFFILLLAMLALYVYSIVKARKWAYAYNIAAFNEMAR